MTPELKQKWVEALRSGKYEQGTGQLRMEGIDDKRTYYCCLGVLACVIGWKEEDFIDSMPLYKYDKGGFTENECAQLGISPIMQDNLMNMNDDEKKSFSEIADYIERNL